MKFYRSLCLSLWLAVPAVGFAAGHDADLTDILTTSLAVTGLVDACIRQTDDFPVQAYQQWRNENHLDGIERYMETLARKDKQFAQGYRKAKAKVEHSIKAMVPKQCGMVPRVFSAEKYQIAKLYPDRIASMLKQSDVPSDSSSVEKAKSGTRAKSGSRAEAEKVIDKGVLEDNVEDIETVVFIHDGATRPVVLFENGEACTDMEALVFTGGLDGHKRQYPGRWATWRGSDGDYELRSNGRWSKVDYPDDTPPVESGHKLNGSYRHLGGRFSAGWTRAYNFSPDGRFSLDAMGFANVEGTSGSSASLSVYSSGSSQGRYEIDGYILTLHFDDGTLLYRSIVVDPDGEDVVWIDGPGYVRKQ